MLCYGFFVELEYFLQQTKDVSRRFLKLEMRHNAQKMLAETLNCNTFSVVSTLWKDDIIGSFLFSVWSYYCAIPDARGMTYIRSSTMVQRQCVSCFVSLHYIQDLRIGLLMIATGTTEVWSRVKNTLSSQESLEYCEIYRRRCCRKMKIKEARKR